MVWAVCVAVLGLCGIGLRAGDARAAQASPRIQPFDQGWRFYRGEAPGAEAPGLDDSAWRTVDTPHDWSIEDLPPLARSETAEARLDLSRGTWRFKAGDDPNWRAADLDDAAWRQVQTPANWEEHGQSQENNVYGWYRRRIEVPEGFKGKDLLIDLGSIDDCDEAFVNGQRVGATGTLPPNYASAYDQPRLYTVPARLLKADGTDLIAVRVFDGPGNGGFTGGSAPAIRIGPFDGRASQGQASTGWVVGGTGWYRKHFRLDGLAADRRVEVLFDGVYMDADVWLNGRHLGNHPYGYTSFSMDLTPYLIRGGDNCLAVRVRNEGKNSRWYSGSGIFRHVWLTTTGPVYIPTWGLFVTTPSVSVKAATVLARVDLANAGPSGAEAVVNVHLLDPQGRTVARGQASGTVGGHGRSTLNVECRVNRPRLWSPATPVLYRAVAEVQANGRTVDRCEATFGIRTVEVDADKGLRINGEPVELRGGCMHHDNGILGAAAIDRAEERRVERMKAAGYNAIRTSHNPPSGAFLDACDRLGILVMDEAFDHWREQKNPQDYHRFFNDWWERDIASMVLRDRNHPWVILWSIGNEIDYPNDPYGHPSFANVEGNNDANKPAAERRYDPDKPNAERLVPLAQRLKAIVRQWDPTRPVTAAVAFPEVSNITGYCDVLDVCDYNYKEQWYAQDHARYPQRRLLGSENGHHYAAWLAVRDNPYIAGQFLWTGIDYLGEARGWPVHGSAAGLLTTAGYPKALYGFRRSLWRDEPVAHLVTARLEDEGSPLWRGMPAQWRRYARRTLQSDTWNYAPGDMVEVTCTTNCPQVELLLNGASQGTYRLADFPEEGCIICAIPYAPGTLEAVATAADGQVVRTCLCTTGPAAALEARAYGEPILQADGEDVAQIEVTVVDAEGRRVPGASDLVGVIVEGAASLLGIDNGDLEDNTCFAAGERRAYQGRLIVYVRAAREPGRATVTVHARGALRPATVQLEVR